jgi:uroporphyrinogen decarboxylase
MTKIERILASIRGEAVDKTPKGEFYLEDGLSAKLLRLTSSEHTDELDLEARIKACELLGLDALVIMPKVSPREESWKELKQWRSQTDFFLFALIDGPFQGISHRYSDFTTFLMDTSRDREKLSELAKEVITESARLGKAALESGANGILIADDIAYTQGLFVSPHVMREVFFPYLEELVQELTQYTVSTGGGKVPIFFHSDGNILTVLYDLKEIGFDGIHSLEPVMDIALVREVVGSEICLMGGYDLGWFGFGGTSKADELLKNARVGGGYIFGSSAGILDTSLSAHDLLEVYRFVDDYDVRNKP